MSKVVGRGHERPGAVADLAGRRAGRHVQAEDRVGPRIVEHALLDHHARAPPSSPAGAPSSAGWKMNFTVPGRSLAHAGQHLGHAQQDRGVGVVAAGVHHADLLAVVGRRPSSANGRSTSSVTGSASMSARSATTGPGLPPLRMPTTPVCATPVPHLEAERLQVLGRPGRRADLAVAELRMGVDVASPLDHLPSIAADASSIPCAQPGPTTMQAEAPRPGRWLQSRRLLGLFMLDARPKGWSRKVQAARTNDRKAIEYSSTPIHPNAPRSEPPHRTLTMTFIRSSERAPDADLSMDGPQALCNGDPAGARPHLLVRLILAAAECSEHLPPRNPVLTRG